MTFDNINTDTSCNCLEDTIIDIDNSYVRKLRKEILEEKDFLTHWERNLKADNADCKKICSSKSVSINQFKPETEVQILEKYKTTFNINPKKGAYYVKFQFLQNAGKVKHTPDIEFKDESHFDFYKADDFSFDKIRIIDTVKFV